MILLMRFFYFRYWAATAVMMMMASTTTASSAHCHLIICIKYYIKFKRAYESNSIYWFRIFLSQHWVSLWFVVKGVSGIENWVIQSNVHVRVFMRRSSILHFAIIHPFIYIHIHFVVFFLSTSFVIYECKIHKRVHKQRRKKT